MSDKSQDCIKSDKNLDSKNMFTVEEEDTPDSNSGSFCSMPDIVKESIVKTEKKLDKSKKCSSLESSLNEMPNFTKFGTLRYNIQFLLFYKILTITLFFRKETTRYQSLRSLPKLNNEEDLKIGSDKYRSLCDPYFPLLRDDNYAVSKALYDKQLSQHYADLDFKIQTENGNFLLLYSYIIISNHIN